MATVSLLPESAARSKSAPARPHPRAYQRSYLSSLLSSQFDVPLVLIEAPRGYGKTTLLASMAHRSGANVRWLSLDAKDRDLNTCVANLCASLYNLPLDAARTNVNSNTYQAARLIISAFKELSVDTLILDNYEEVFNSDPVNAMVEQIVSELPPLTQVVIATQKPPAFKRGARLRSRMTEINSADLRFDADDVAGYFETIARYRLSSAEANQIIQRTDGQPVTINLLSQLAYGLQSYLRINFDALPLAPGEQTLIYLLREVFKRLPYPLDEAAQVLGNLRRTLSDEPDLEPSEEDPKPSLEETAAAAMPLLEKLATQYCLVHELNLEPRTLLPHPMLFDIGSLL